MLHGDKEKIAIVLINEYKKLVNRIKKGHMKSAIGKIQVIEVGLHSLTEDRPVAREFFGKVLEYRRDPGNEIRRFEIPEIKTDPKNDKESIPVLATAKETQKVHQSATQVEPKKPETKKEECPFEF